MGNTLKNPSWAVQAVVHPRGSIRGGLRYSGAVEPGVRTSLGLRIPKITLNGVKLKLGDYAVIYFWTKMDVTKRSVGRNVQHKNVQIRIGKMGEFRVSDENRHGGTAQNDMICCTVRGPKGGNRRKQRTGWSGELTSDR